MRFASASVPTHRIQRLYRWLRVWVLWWLPAMAAWFVLVGRADARALDRIARGVCNIIYLQAIVRAKPPRRVVRYGPRGRRRCFKLRHAQGARLRQAVRARDFATRVFKIVAFVRDAEAHIARQVRRLESGFRKGGAKACAGVLDVALALAPAAMPACVDSS